MEMEKETFVPGMEGEHRDYDNLYARKTYKPSDNMDATYIPEMEGNPFESEQKNQQNMQKKVGHEEPVVGFLYSISRMGIGEYWPLHLGANTIGRSGKSDIQLKEMSVSDNHAVLNVRKMKSTSDVIASVRDVGSKNGMYLNDIELDFENHSCKNGDILTIGTCYQLLIILINTQQYGLKVAKDFMPYKDETPVQEINSDPFAQFNNGKLYARHKAKQDDGTIDLGGASPFISGKTNVL